MRAVAAMVVLAMPFTGAIAQGVSYPPPARQIAAAVSPLPEPLQKGATVLGFDERGSLVTLRSGTNEMICVADDPARRDFHVACYHKSLDPFMVRGRELRAKKLSTAAIDSARTHDVGTGRLIMPAKPAALYQYFASRDSIDAATGTVRGAQHLYVVYTPGATYQSTGISEQPVAGGPWIMYPGTPFAHLMIMPTTRVTVELK